MAIATYNTDLATIVLCETGDTFEEFTGYALGDNAVLETDWYLQGSSCASDEANNKTGVGHSIGYDYGSGVTFSTGDCFFAWMMCMMPNAPDTFSNGGYRVLIGGDVTNFDGWKVGGSDFGRNPYGGWVNVVVDPTYTADYTGGTGGSGTYQHFAIAFVLVNSTLKGRPNCADAMRYGRGELYIEHGEISAYGTFAAMASANDAQSARWGLFQAEGSGYLWKGLISLGTSTYAVDFRDSNRNITIDDTPRTYAAFNKIEINHPGSNVEWTGISIIPLNASGLSIGQLEVTDSTALVNFNICTFTDMNTFIFELNCTINDTTFRRCGQVTQGGGVFDGCIFEESDATVSLLVDDLDNIDNCDFISDGSNHAMRLTEEHAGKTFTLTGCTYTGYAGSNGSTGNECIFNDSSGAVTINVIGGDTPTIRNGAGASTSLPTSVTLTMTVKDEDGNVIVGAFAYIDDDNQTPFIMNTTTNASGIATVQHTGGSVNDSTWRVRKYGYKAYKQTVDIAGSDISIPVTLIVDPQQT